MDTLYTLRELNSENLCKDYGEALSCLEDSYGAGEDLACWRIESVAIEEVVNYQIIDDPDDEDGWRKVNELSLALRSKQRLPPPLVLVHLSLDGHDSYDLLDGRHRFNAAHKEEITRLPAWVAHVGCCGGPTTDSS